MFFYLIIAVTVTACFASEATVAPVICGEIPQTIYSCIGNPRFIKPRLGVNCTTEVSECEKLTCIFTNSGWLKDGSLVISKILVHYNQFARDYPEWSTAVRYAKATCLASNLPAQGVYLNCPAYDIMICSLSSFVKYALPHQWSTAAQCLYPKQYAAACPLCPSECFAALVPYGSCNACLQLPRSP